MALLPLYRLKINSPLHISNVRSDYDNSLKMIHSDTLYAAVMQAWAILGKSEWIDEFQQTDIPLTISSLFPFCPVKEGSFVYFLPKPFAQPRTELSDPSDAKKLKKIAWLDIDFFSNILKWKATPFNKESTNGVYQSLKLPKDRVDFIFSDIVPRILRPRNEAEDTKIFYMERLYFKYESGLYFFFETKKKMWEERFETALNYLMDAGLGTDRTIGNGSFTWERDLINIEIPEKASYFLNLSLFSPESQHQLEKMIDKDSRYEVVKRGGWIGEPYNTYRKKSVYMFKEGSMFNGLEILDYKTQIASAGNTHNLIPDNAKLPPENQVAHPIWRVGKSLFLPINFSQ